jgi:hypothetical protein
MSHNPATRTRALAALLVFALCLLIPTAALGITRAQVLTRAKTWVKHPVKYSQTKYHLGYRTDCSGYVSMCWGTGRSWSTATFHRVTHGITKGDLRPGDAMLKPGYHVRLFHHWANRSRTYYVAWESGYGKVAVRRVHKYSTDTKAGFAPTRYNETVEARVGDELLWDGSFNAWSGGWGSGGTPVMWTVSGAPRHTLVTHRWDTAHAGRNSLQLLASANDSGTPTDISQPASVTAGALYRARTWARTLGDSNAVSLHLDFLGTDGASIAETSASGAQFGVDATAFRPISVLASAPAGAVNAVVTVRLSAPATGASVPSSATVDDVSLVRLRAGVSIKPSSSTVRRSGRVTLSGAVLPSPTSTITAGIYVKPPGRGWRRFADARVMPTDGGAWRARYTFKRSMRKGVYYFRTSVPSFDGYLGKTSRTISVRLK